ncbi:siderophore ABC transporter substrate-binding protein [Rhodobacter sp. NTK016B]|uniref:siderophore ABC transporter substrate-binding protein n=1 Tax=Rhodobacter sp. NTK016B TaxID=2759676 RepID=UPI001A8CA6B0|nr:siderophore ABC transporter substrate-binding protein [Rhodobacter sp. NTK016B]MBN8293684.1 siderophore ABC transporter substrate-binding protein [Rhodobacter sp. NTK016B]
MKPSLSLLALAIAPLFPASQALAQEVTVATFAGPAQAPAQPDRVVALDLAAIDSLAALGVALDGVPAIRAPAYLAPALDGVPTMGTLFEPDFESLAVMEPDLIIAGGRSQPQVAALNRIAPTLDMTIGGDVVGQSRERLRAYGQIFGLQDRAETLIAQSDAQLAEARASIEGRGAALIVLTNGGTVSAYGGDSRFGWLHSALGLPEAAPGITAENHGESVSFEFIAETDPDWLLVIDRAAAIGQEGEAASVTLDNPLVQGTRAGLSGQIIYLDSAALYLAGGGVQATARVVGQIAEAFTAAGR